MEAISRSCLPAAAARTKRQRKATCCGVLGAASHRTTCSRSSAAKLTSGLILAMRTRISYWPQYVYLFMIHTTSYDTMRVLLDEHQRIALQRNCVTDIQAAVPHQPDDRTHPSYETIVFECFGDRAEKSFVLFIIQRHRRWLVHFDGA